MYANGILAAITGGPLRPGGDGLTGRLIALCGLRRGDRVVDVGCGNGRTLRRLAEDYGITGVGMDLSAGLLDAGRREYPELLAALAQAAALPLAADTIDAVLAECSLSVMGEIDSSLAETWRVLRPGGRLGISDIYVRAADGGQAAARLRGLPLTCGFANARAEAEWRARLAAHGFCVDAWEDHSVEWKRLAGQVGQAPGAAAAFWRANEPDCDPFELLAAVGKANPGYFLLSARKNA